MEQSPVAELSEESQLSPELVDALDGEVVVEGTVDVGLVTGEVGLSVGALVPPPVCVPSSSQSAPVQEPVSQSEPLHVSIEQFGPLQEPVLLSQSGPEHPTLIQAEPEHLPVFISQSDPSQPDVLQLDPMHTPLEHPAPMHPEEIQSSPIHIPFEHPDPEQPNETHRIPVHEPLLQSGPLHCPSEVTGYPVAVMF